MSTLQSILKPTSIARGLNVNYTVPVGRISLVTVFLDVSSATRVDGRDMARLAVNASANSLSGKLTLMAGDVLSSTRATGAGSISMPYNNDAVKDSVATCVVNVNASACLSCSANSNGWGVNSSSSSAATGYVQSTGSSNFSFVAEEYLE